MDETILIVDRAETTRRSLSQALTRSGWSVLGAEGVESAGRIVDCERVDVAVLDLASLGEEGLRFLSRIRRHRHPAATILLARPDQVALSIRGMKLGAFDDVAVPVDIDVLSNRIAAALEVRGTRTDRTGPGGPRRER
jgi:DNA-binding response OmpR family regulator